jgi:Uma2 family endonuclease
MVVAAKTEITLDGVLALGPDARIEIINGEIIEMSPVGGLHQFVGRNIFKILDAFVTAQALGIVLYDGLIYLLGKKTRYLKDSYVPDVSYLRKGSIPANWDIVRPFPGTPTLAVEIMSPTDSVEIVLRKVREYLKAGSDEVWVVYPQQQEIHQYRRSSPDTVRVYTEDNVLDTSDLFPGLILRATDIFALPDLS